MLGFYYTIGPSSGIVNAELRLDSVYKSDTKDFLIWDKWRHYYGRYINITFFKLTGYVKLINNQTKDFDTSMTKIPIDYSEGFYPHYCYFFKYKKWNICMRWMWYKNESFRKYPKISVEPIIHKIKQIKPKAVNKL